MTDTREQDLQFVRDAIALAHKNVGEGGRPFGAIVVKDGKAIAAATNVMHLSNDPTAHAELVALRVASQNLGTMDLSGCSVYASGHPCPMCMAAMRLTGIEKVVYAYSNSVAEPYGLSNAKLYEDLRKPFAEQSMHITHLPVDGHDKPQMYEEWARLTHPRP